MSSSTSKKGSPAAEEEAGTRSDFPSLLAIALKAASRSAGVAFGFDGLILGTRDLLATRHSLVNAENTGGS